ncbi:MAG TPA: DUF202 domain-containing protein [Streptosporangiaceae bacterium]|nr:DUF202 domain-containing protein [Streptosporangiaceae bacterium]
MTPGPAEPPDRPPGRAPAPDMEDIDPGQARARTHLAWTRTAISFAALGAAILKTSPAVGAVVLAASGLIWGAGRLAGRSRRPGRDTQSRLRDDQSRLLLVTVAVTTVALGALALAVLAGSALPLR